MPNLNTILVAADFDQSLTSNDNIESFTPNTGNPKPFKAARAGMVYFAVSERVYSEGQERIASDGSVSYAGFPQVVYTQPACHPDSYTWLITNYRGQVTCQVCTDGTTYSQYNASLRFKKEASPVKIGWYQVRWIFTLVEAL